MCVLPSVRRPCTTGGHLARACHPIWYQRSSHGLHSSLGAGVSIESSQTCHPAYPLHNEWECRQSKGPTEGQGVEGLHHDKLEGGVDMDLSTANEEMRAEGDEERTRR